MPNTYTGISPYEMLYGMPYSQGMPLNENLIYIKTITENIKELREKGILAQTAPLDFAIQKIKPGDKVLIKTRETAVRTTEERLDSRVTNKGANS